MRFLAVLSTVITVAFSSAYAAPNQSFPVDGPGADIGLSTPTRGYIWHDPSDPELGEVWQPGDTQSHGGSHILFLNRCAGGETISPGGNDSRNNRSSIIGSPRTFPAYPYGDASWNQIVAHSRDIFAPFGIQVTDVDPGSSPHHEAIVCGTSFFGPGVLGVAPGTCGVIENSITFTFAQEIGNDPRFIAETLAQEAAHAWGMDHEFDCEDPMTYLNGCGYKYFQNADLSCAGVSDDNRWVRQNCMCGGSTQNSFQRIRALFGAADPTPPNVAITAPADGEAVQAGFVIRTNISDDQGIDVVRVLINGAQIVSSREPPFVFNAPGDMSEGQHRVQVIAADVLGAEASATVNVIIGEPCGGDSDCGGGEICLDGRCVLGPGNPGGLGEACSGGGDCASGICAGNSSGVQVCTEGCDLDAQGCPSGFTCREAGGSSVCWPGSGDGGGGCRVGGDERAPLGGIAALGLLMLIAARRRRGAR